MKHYLAIDIGASSGRHIAGWLENDAWKTDEVYRFPNGVVERDGHLVWDIDALLDHVKKGIALAKERYEIESLSIDTWGVDYVLLNGDETICPEKPWSEITAEAEASAFQETVDANAAAFLAPESMQAAFDSSLRTKPQTAGDCFRCAYRSLALSYKQAIEELERNTQRTYDKLYIVGGGAKNGFLNRLTEEATGKTVIALPIETTALGNLKIQTEVNA